MQKGKIKKLIRGKGFGFISAGNGKDLFFHRSSFNYDFDALKEGQEVEFEVEESPKGQRAINVGIV